jgi:hypothetical protein
VWVIEFIMLTLKWKLFHHPYLHRRCRCSMGLAAWPSLSWKLSIQRVDRTLHQTIDSGTTVGSRGRSRGSCTLDLEQLHKWVWHHILTQNFNALDLWILSLIKYWTTYSSNTCHNTYTVITCYKRA